MAHRRERAFNGAAKTIVGTASSTETISWNGSEINSGAPGAGVVAYHLSLQGSATAAAVSGLRVKANGQTIYDIDLAAYSGWLERFTQANTTINGAGTRLSIWLNAIDIADDEASDSVSQFPYGTSASLEVTLTSGSSFAGSAVLGWTTTNVPAMYYPSLTGQAMNIAASAVNQNYYYDTADGFLRGWGVAAANINEGRFIVSGDDVFSWVGPSYNGSTFGDMAREAEAAENPYTLTTYNWHNGYMMQAAQGTSRIQLTTGASWTTAQKLYLWTLRPQARQGR